MNQIILDLQKTLTSRGYPVGPVDGDLGPKTYAAFLGAMVGRDLGALGLLLGRAMASDFPKYDVVTPRRIIHFVAQAAHETQGFRYFTELGSGDKNHDGYDDYLIKYDRRADLGNTPALDGDGEKYRGRGIFQLTGSFNYRSYGRRIGVDLIANPKRAAEPEIAVLLACLYWSDKGLNLLADADATQAITRKINGGLNGLNDRVNYVVRGKNLWAI